MSKYLAYREIVFRDRQLLLDALAELGFSNIEEGDDLPLYGYQGDRRSEAAALVVRRQDIGSGSNDLGFATSEGGYFPIISEYDKGTLLAGQFLPSSAWRMPSAWSRRCASACAAACTASTRAA